MNLPRVRARSRLAVFAWAVGAAGLVGALLLTSSILSEDAALLFSDIIYLVVAPVAGGLLVVAARRVGGRDGLAWTFVGAGVLAEAAGETVWVFYELVLKLEPPYPGLPDVFYLAGYPLIGIGLLLMPHLRTSGYQKAGVLLDAVAGTSALAIIAWVTILRPIWELSEGTPGLELAIGLAYPLGDLVLLSAVIVLSTRRTNAFRRRALVMTAVGLAAFAVGDFSYLVQTWFEVYVSGSWTDGLWLLSYGIFATTAALLFRPAEPFTDDARSPSWPSTIPYVSVAVLVFLHLQRLLGSPVDDVDLTLAVGAVAVGALVLVRQWVTIHERRQLLALERAQLVSVVSHELRTPLTAAEGFLGLLSQHWPDFPDEERQEMARIAEQQTRHLSRIVSDLIQVSRGGLHAAALDKEQVRVAAVIEEAAGLVEDMAHRQVEYTVSSIEWVTADRQRLVQVLVNLLTNACRYGGDRISVVTRRQGEEVEIQIHDDGPGVPVRHQSSIWEKFERGAHSLNASVPGSGLGLAVVRSIIAGHGGEVGYHRSRILGGACFWLRLPAPAMAAQQVASV